MSNLLTTAQGLITIRSATLADAAALRELRLEALAAHPDAFAADYELTSADPVERWQKLIGDYADGDRGVVCVAAAGEGLVGMLGLVRGHWPKTRHAGTVWGVYVRPGWRGRRVAGALLDECCAWGRAHGLTVIKLSVTTGNAPAVRCYVRCGFTVYGVDPEVICYEGATYDELLLARRL